jgi:predicted amidohydrolase
MLTPTWRNAERLVRVAFEQGANWVILPELFSSGNAFHPEMATATRAIDGPPAKLLRDLARQGNAAVGGSFLAWRDGKCLQQLRFGTTRRKHASTRQGLPNTLGELLLHRRERRRRYADAARRRRGRAMLGVYPIENGCD